MSEIPSDLKRYLADAELEVIRWDGTRGDLDIRVTKEIGPETGTLFFRDVSYLALTPWLTVQSIMLGDRSEHPDGHAPDEDESIFWIHSAWGQQYCVIAKSIDYQADAAG